MGVLRGDLCISRPREKPSAASGESFITNVPSDTAPHPLYSAERFPNPQLEEDERGQLNGIIITDNELYSYAGVDEKPARCIFPLDPRHGVARRRGLPVHPQGAAGDDAKTRRAKRSDQQAETIRFPPRIRSASQSHLLQLPLGTDGQRVMSPPANTRPPRLENVGIDSTSDAQVPPDLIFRDDAGKTVN